MNRIPCHLIENESILKYQLEESALATAQLPFLEYKRILTEVSQKNANIMIPLSGGIDSELIAMSCLENQIPFTAVIMKFSQDMNDYDIQFALEFCRKNKINPTILEIDLDDFFKKEKHLLYAEKYDCMSPQLATHLWMLDQIDGYFIFAYNPLPMLLDRQQKRYIGFPSKKYLCYEQYLIQNHKQGIGNFHIYDSQIVYSFLKLPLYLESFFDFNFFRHFSYNNYYLKVELYRQGGLQAALRKDKYTGFEKYRKYLNEKNNTLESADFFDVEYRRPMEQLAGRDQMAVGTVNYEKLFDIYSQALPAVKP